MSVFGWVGLSIVLGASVAGISVRAEVMQFYYLGAPAEVSNTAVNPADRMGVNTGYLTIDTASFGGDLAGKQLYCDWKRGRCDSQDEVTGARVVDYGFSLWTGGFDSAYTIDFDAAGEIEKWRFKTSAGIGGSGGQVYSIGGGATRRASYIGEKYHQYADSHEYADAKARTFLTDLGYVEGTPEYQAQYCGIWAGQTCTGWGGAAPAWATDFSTGAGGRWFSDKTEYDLALVGLGGAAAGGYPRSYYDISAPAPVPVPLPLALLGMGIVGLIGFGRSGRAWTSGAGEFGEWADV